MAKDIEKQAQVAPRYTDRFGTRRSKMDRLFDTFMGGLPTFPSMFGPGGGRGFALTSSLDVKKRIRKSWSRLNCRDLMKRMSHNHLRSVLHSKR
jgi:hypothetical protein